ncbi:MAG: rhomboid family intramembrane serine protease [Porticoccaceae bacterium]
MTALLQQFRRTPVVMAMLVLGAIGGLLVDWLPGAIHWLTFQDFVVTAADGISYRSLDDGLASGQYWRLITPVFLHFGLLHIVFNGLWLWEFGRRIEGLVGGFGFLGLFVVVAVGSNGGQYLWSGSSLFGGLSGVVYGLLGYIWLRGSLAPHPLLMIPSGILIFMLVWLVLCLAGVIDLFIQGGVANGAHVAGLVMGVVLGGIAGFRARGKIG